MVKHGDAPLDRIFAALADPTRRALLARLAQEPDLSVSALAAPFAVSLPAIMKHLDVLSDAGLVARRKSGRTVACRLKAAPMRDAVTWLNRYERFWSEALSRLSDYLQEDSLEDDSLEEDSLAEDFLEEDDSCPSKPQSNQASPSSGASKHRRRKSSRHGPTRKK